jgi:hypothetical protein
MQAADSGQVFVNKVREPKGRGLASKEDIDNTDQSHQPTADPGPTQQGGSEFGGIWVSQCKGDGPGEQRNFANDFGPSFALVGGP